MKWLALPIVFSALLGCSKDGASAQPARTEQSTAPGVPAAQAVQAALPAGMTRVADVSKVCMVNDQYMGVAQIPVEVDGRTYYGCCAMCEEKLNNLPEARLATDPVTGEQVDKATAVIVQDASGKVTYFASEATLQRWNG